MPSTTLSQEVIFHDVLPASSRCQWCRHLAVEQITVLCSPHHNQHGRFCASCAAAFIDYILAHKAFPHILRTTIGQPSGISVPTPEQRLMEDLEDETILCALKPSFWLCQAKIRGSLVGTHSHLVYQNDIL